MPIRALQRPAGQLDGAGNLFATVAADRAFPAAAAELVRRGNAMSLVDPKRRYRFYRGEKLVGMVTVVDSNQPYFCGRIDPAEGFGEIAPFLDRLAQNRRHRASPEIVGVSAEKREARQQRRNEYEAIIQEFTSPGLRMVDADTGELVFEPLDLEVDERGFWWNGHIWRDGKRII